MSAWVLIIVSLSTGSVEEVAFNSEGACRVASIKLADALGGYSNDLEGHMKVGDLIVGVCVKRDW